MKPFWRLVWRVFAVDSGFGVRGVVGSLSKHFERAALSPSSLQRLTIEGIRKVNRMQQVCSQSCERFQALDLHYFGCEDRRAEDILHPACMEERSCKDYTAIIGVGLKARI